jgi:hypothetical protein
MALTQVNGGLIESGGITPTQLDTQAQYTGFKNRIINGAMQIDQRNAGASVTPTSSQYTLDRWQALLTQTSKFSVQQNAGSVTPPNGFTNYLGITSLSAYSISTTDQFLITQRIEGLNVSDLGWGTANASTVTLSFWVRSSLTGTFGGSIQNIVANRNYPFNYSISNANTWELKTVTIAGDTTGTWQKNNEVGLILNWSLGTGSTYSATAGAWTTSNFITSTTGATSVVGTSGATFYITGVQLEKGSTATSFDYRPYTTELQLCERYCQVIRSASIGRTTAVNIIGACYMFPVLFRASPTATFVTYTISTGATGTPAIFGATVNSIEFYNAANNWTAQALLQVSATISAEL